MCAHLAGSVGTGWPAVLSTSTAESRRVGRGDCADPDDDGSEWRGECGD